MIVNQLCTHLTGGASMAAQRLHGSLRLAGVDSRFWYSPRTKTASSDPSIRRINWPEPTDWSRRLRRVLTWFQRRMSWKWTSYRHLRGRPDGFEIFSPARLPTDTCYRSTVLPGDILHLHWVAKLIDAPSFFASLPDDLPIVWTLHDMNPFTGGCHFSSGCDAFQVACGNCHQIARSHENDLSRQLLGLKCDAVCNKNLHVVAPSQWLTEAARKSVVFAGARSFHTIPYGLDTTALSPQIQTAARQRFQLPERAFVLGFGADSLTNRRKGFQELLAALKQVRAREPIIALVFGEGELPADIERGVKIVPVGYVKGSERLANLYSAMSVFVMPSLEDNLPQTGLEAMACGTPVVAFDTGGIPDFVVPAQTGLLARKGDAADLARQIQWLLDRPDEIRPLGQQARRLIEERFNSRREAEDYIALYRDILAGEQPMRKTQAA